MLKYFDIIKETPIARTGDWDGSGSALIGNTTKFVYEKDWTIVDNVVIKNNAYSIARHKTEIAYIVGIPQSNGTFNRYFLIELEPSSQIGGRFGYRKLFSVVRVMTSKTVQGEGIATFMYKWLCRRLYPIMSVREQYFGARRLWASLSRDASLSIDVVNLDTNKIVEHNATLYHGDKDGDFDQRYWSSDAIKEPFRFVVKPRSA